MDLGQCERYFLDGLTARDVASREQNLADLFTALGRLTHLVADVSVPEHSRNDAHVIASHYETWCKANLVTLDNTIDGVQVFDNSLMPSDAIFAQPRGSAFGSDPLSPVSNLWDSRSSGTGDNPLLWATDRLAGLADYSNYNYFSGDMVFDSVHYPHPSLLEVDLDLLPITASDGRTDYVYFFKRTASDGIAVSHLAVTGFHYQDLLDQGLAIAFQAAHLDEYCWKEYAKNLVPRAVSYGTTLVDYIFRGKFDATGSGNTLTVTNRSSGTATGTFTVYRDDPSDGLRKPVPGLENLALAESGLGSGSAATITPSVFLPPSSTDNLLLVFTGKLANEGAAPNADAVVAGKAFSWTAPQAPPLPPKFHVGGRPRGLAVTPDGKKIFVANPAGNSVFVVNLLSAYNVTTIPDVGNFPVEVAVSHNGSKAFVSNEWGAFISVIDAVNDRFLGSIPDLRWTPEELAVSPDGTYLFVSNSFEGTISAIPTVTPPAAAAQGTMATAASSSEDPGWGLALLRGFPPGRRVYADGEIPRREAQFEEGLSVSFPSETRELFLFCPGYRNRAVPVSVGPGETVVLDGQLLPE